MLNLLQKNRFLQVTSQLGKDALIPIDFQGTEGISRLFGYSLSVISSKLNIKPADLIETPISVAIYQNQLAKPRYFHGLVKKFRAGHIEGNMRRYEIVLSPWLGMLQYEKNYRIFKDKTVKEILETIFEEHGFFDYKFSKMQIKHPPREYCTQYDETTLHFVQRLLEEEGMFYFFEHTKDQHKMIIADDFSIHAPCPNHEIIYTGENMSGEKHYINSWERGYQMYAGKFMHTDYNYKTSTKGLQTHSNQDADLPQAKAYSVHNYPGGYSEFDNGADLANYRVESQQAQHNIVHASGNHLEFFAGSQFKLTKHPEKSEVGEYILTEVTHSAQDNSYLSGTTGAASGDSQHYSNTFRCVHKATNYRPPRITTKPKAGVQTAFVVGPEGEEISTDTFGRIQVRFHWIRQEGKYIGAPASRWVRVAQTWGGNGYGAWFLPRIRQEVVVQFLNDDPDEPLVIGCVYNEHRKQPFAQPGNKTQSGIKTRSSKGGGGENILRFEDKKGQEEIYIHAEKDMNEKIKHDLSIIVDNDDKQHIKHDLSIEVDNNYTHETKQNESHKVGKNRTENIGEHLTIYIGKTARIEAKDSITLKVGSSAIQLTPSKIILHSPDVVCNDEPIGG